MRTYFRLRRADRELAAGICTNVGNDSFGETGITAYLRIGGTLVKAAQMADHANTGAKQICDRRRDEMSPDKVERIKV